MLPLRDNVPTRTFPIVTVALIVVNVLVWVLYQLPNLQGSVTELAYQPCELVNTCPTVGQDWEVTAFTSMFMHGSWAHLLGNMLFLWIFGNNVEDALGAYLLLLPRAKVLTIIFFVLREVPAVLFLGIWFGFQLIDGSAAIAHPEAGGGVAFFAHIGGFVFGFLTVKLVQQRQPLAPTH